MSLEFTEKYGINVNVNVVQGGLVEASLAGNAPDVVIDCARGQPVNLASRNALADLSQFPGYEEVTRRFTQDAMVPYTYKEGVYALPLTQTYLMMFYRTDIFEEMNLTVPQTWDELLKVSAKLQRNNMTVGLPYTAISASGAVNLGVGAKDLYPTLLLQYGGNYYNQELTQTMLDSSAALNAFKTWTQFYTQYSFPLSYDFNSRFRTGEMPLAVASLSMYGILSAAAPEIRGQWEMTLMPGTLQADGSIDRSGGASGTAIVMMDSAQNKDACWKYMSWFTETQTQVDYGTRLENLLGASARLASANLEAFHRLNWSEAELAVLDAQRRFVREIPELPGGYYTSRCIDNAFRAVVYQYKNERVELEKANDTINRELQRKREELS
jgi:ABC-type glycerol-3-phosphate transport system substrate-binding protein